MEALKPAVHDEPESGIVRVANYAWRRSDVIKLWVGEGDLPTPSFICDAATRAMANGDFGAKPGKPLRCCARLQVRA